MRRHRRFLHKRLSDWCQVGLQRPCRGRAQEYLRPRHRLVHGRLHNVVILVHQLGRLQLLLLLLRLERALLLLLLLLLLLRLERALLWQLGRKRVTVLPALGLIAVAFTRARLARARHCRGTQCVYVGTCEHCRGLALRGRAHHRCLWHRRSLPRGGPQGVHSCRRSRDQRADRLSPRRRAPIGRGSSASLLCQRRACKWLLRRLLLVLRWRQRRAVALPAQSTPLTLGPLCARPLAHARACCLRPRAVRPCGCICICICQGKARVQLALVLLGLEERLPGRAPAWLGLFTLPPAAVHQQPAVWLAGLGGARSHVHPLRARRAQHTLLGEGHHARGASLLAHGRGTRGWTQRHKRSRAGGRTRRCTLFPLRHSYEPDDGKPVRQTNSFHDRRD